MLLGWLVCAAWLGRVGGLPATCGAVGPAPAIPPLSPATGGTPVLEQVHALFRHGDRSAIHPDCFAGGDAATWDCPVQRGSVPVDLQATSPPARPARLYAKAYSDKREPAGPGTSCANGMLTRRGYQQELANGAALRAAYVSPRKGWPELEPEAVTVVSDDVPRTVLSAVGVLEGLFPGSLGKNGSQAEVIQIHTEDRSRRFMDPNEQRCPARGRLVDMARESPESKQRLAEVSVPLAMELATMFGPLAAKRPRSAKVYQGGDWQERQCSRRGLEYFPVLKLLKRVHDCTTARICHGHPLPVGFDEKLRRRVEAEVIWHNERQFKYPDRQTNARTGVGFLLKRLRLNMQLGGKPAMRLYSGHDTTLQAVLVAYDMAPTSWIPYASMLVVEVYRMADGSKAVRWVLNGKVLRLPVCGQAGELCPMSVFDTYTQARLAGASSRQAADADLAGPGKGVPARPGGGA